MNDLFLHDDDDKMQKNMTGTESLQQDTSDSGNAIFD